MAPIAKKIAEKGRSGTDMYVKWREEWQMNRYQELQKQMEEEDRKPEDLCKGVMGSLVRHPVGEDTSSSIVYHRLIYSTQSVGAMLWSMAQLRRGQLRMVVDVVGSC